VSGDWKRNTTVRGSAELMDEPIVKYEDISIEGNIYGAFSHIIIKSR